jgi:hypothetical protein
MGDPLKARADQGGGANHPEAPRPYSHLFRQPDRQLIGNGHIASINSFVQAAKAKARG